MQSPYATLDVPPTATAEEIKHAYRKAAAAAHPDRNGGDGRRMQEVNDAYAILGDAERRAHYDATGESKEASHLQDAKAMLQNELGKILEDGNVYDLVDGLHKAVLKIEANAAAARAMNQLRERLITKRLKSLKCSSENDFLVGVIDGRLKSVLETIEQADEALKTIAIAKQLLTGYSHQAEEVMPRQGAQFLGYLGMQGV